MSQFGERILRREIDTLVKEYERMSSIRLNGNGNKEIHSALELIKQRIKGLNADIDMLNPAALTEKQIA